MDLKPPRSFYGWHLEPTVRTWNRCYCLDRGSRIQFKRSAWFQVYVPYMDLTKPIRTPWFFISPLKLCECATANSSNLFRSSDNLSIFCGAKKNQKNFNKNENADSIFFLEFACWWFLRSMNLFTRKNVLMFLTCILFFSVEVIFIYPAILIKIKSYKNF